jgi:hypothetical protein
MELCGNIEMKENVFYKGKFNHWWCDLFENYPKDV